MESFISTMETSALMGKNVARLVVDDYLNIFGAGEGEQKVVKRGAVISPQEGEEIGDCKLCRLYKIQQLSVHHPEPSGSEGLLHPAIQSRMRGFILRGVMAK
jgi:hypothetical protein